MRRTFVLICSILAVGFVFLVASDFFQIGRQAPDLAPTDERATRVEVNKSARQLNLFRGSEIIRSYKVSLGFSPTGHKAKEGDGRTPEGLYAAEFKNARSRFHLALRVSYPNAEDRKTAQGYGVSPGSDIMIHGLPNGLGWLNRLHLNHDWTDGCIAVTNSEIEDIWRLVAPGTPIEIRP
ncbi:MAG: L,D-transpeptidase family protein [Afipia sp.]|jgi:murein L,D-transpeptidase YafK|nr:L,D-transpeptidase family protein [Afipia sp.]MBS4002463.1 L,D-transpeptidase family protein [Afipia sp.]WIG53349.1 MAG: L,D-transpeptidase [Afipia sp.]